MTGRDPFTDRIKSAKRAETLRKQAAANAARSREDAQARSRIESALSLRAQKRQGILALYNAPRTATKPEDVLSEQDAQLCDEFLSHMSKKIFKKTVEIAERFPRLNFPGVAKVWETPAYQIGRLAFAERTRYSELYLCQDGLLRARSLKSIKALSNSPQSGKIAIYGALPDYEYDFDFGSYVTRTRKEVKVIPPRYRNNEGPEGGPTDGYNETLVTNKVTETVWQPSGSLEQRLIEIATLKGQPLVEV